MANTMSLLAAVHPVEKRAQMVPGNGQSMIPIVVRAHLHVHIVPYAMRQRFVARLFQMEVPLRRVRQQIPLLILLVALTARHPVNARIKP